MIRFQPTKGLTGYTPITDKMDALMKRMMDIQEKKNEKARQAEIDEINRRVAEQNMALQLEQEERAKAAEERAKQEAEFTKAEEARKETEFKDAQRKLKIAEQQEKFITDRFLADIKNQQAKAKAKEAGVSTAALDRISKGPQMAPADAPLDSPALGGLVAQEDLGVLSDLVQTPSREDYAVDGRQPLTLEEMTRLRLMQMRPDILFEQAKRVPRETPQEAAEKARARYLATAGLKANEKEAERVAKQAEKDALKDADAETWFTSINRGVGSLKDVPAAMESAVRQRFLDAGVKPPTRELGEKTVLELSDAQSSFNYIDSLADFDSGFNPWAQSKVPNPIVEWWGLESAESAKSFDTGYFLFATEMLKAAQGGRPSDKDLEFYLSMMPSVYDTPGQKEKKIKIIQARAAEKYNQRLGDLGGSGFNVYAFEPLEYGEPEGGGDAEVDTEALLKKYGY
jgi:hypothetical protein